MKETIRVLVLVSDAWRSDNSGGNTLDNFFCGVEGMEFAHIFCDDQLPKNDRCIRYYQFTQREILHNFCLHRPVGHELHWPVIKNGSSSIVPSKENSFFLWLKRLRPEILLTGRYIAWRYSNWKTEALKGFIQDFNPDVIFAPNYPSPFQLALTRYVKRITGKKVVSWSGDDDYSLRQFSLSPFFWVNRLWARHSMKKTFLCYDEFYSISEEEVEELEPEVNRVREKSKLNCTPLKMGILRKGVHVPEAFKPRQVHQPIKFIYAGGLYLNRHKSLIAIADALRKLNQKDVQAELHIYTGSQLSDKDTALLNDGRSVFNHGFISSDRLAQVYQDYDVAIHCESFDLKYRLMTRLSFSTKIIDCFQSGCAILAIAWKEHTGIKCLKRNDAAFCVTSVKDIEPTVKRIVENPNLIPEYARKAYECEKKNHRIEDVQKTLYDSLVRCAQ